MQPALTHPVAPRATSPRHISEMLDSGEPMFSFEFFPPRTDKAQERLWRAIRELEALNPSFVSVTYGAGGSTRGKTVEATERIATDTTLLPVAHMTLVDHSVAELRHLGGAAARPAADAGAVSAVAGDYIVHGIAVPPAPEAGPAAVAAATGLVDALEPWAGEGLALTFLDGGADRTPGFGASIERLRALKAEWDPRNVFAAANPVPAVGV